MLCCNVGLRGQKILLEARPHGLRKTKALGVFVFRRALDKMQDMPVTAGHHVSVRREIGEVWQETEMHQALVRPEHVEIVGEVIGCEFPCAVDIPDLRNADKFDLAGATEDDVEVPFHFTEPRVQGWRVFVPGRENQSPIISQLCDRYQTEFALFQLALAVMVFRAGGSELAVVAIRPSVIGAAQKPRISDRCGKPACRDAGRNSGRRV